jgi:hypothetical protein
MFITRKGKDTVAWKSAVPVLGASRIRGRMSPMCVSLGVLPDDLYIEPEPWPRGGRPMKHDLSAWTFTDDWSERAPVTDAEVVRA